MKTAVERPWFVAPFRLCHLPYMHVIGKNNELCEISILPKSNQLRRDTRTL